MKQKEIQEKLNKILEMYYDGVIINIEAHQELLCTINEWYILTGVPNDRSRPVGLTAKMLR